MTTTGNGQNGNQKTQKKVEDQIGDPRFLDQIHKCTESRRALLGMDAPKRIAPTSPDGEEAYHSHVMSELMKLAEQGAQTPTVIDASFIEQQVQDAGNEPEGDGTAEERETPEP